MRALGKYTAQMHSVGQDWFGEITNDPAKRFHSWGEAFTAMVEDALASIQVQRLSLPFEDIRSAVASRRAMLNAVEKPALVNFDLWAGNVFVRRQKDGFHLTGIIDFERSFLGDPLASFSSAFLLYDDVEKEAAFLEGYNKASEKKLVITGDDREKMMLYQMLMYLHGYAESYRYGFGFCSLQRIVIRRYLYALLRKLRRMEKKRHLN